jgi:phytoene dehydrogenase-like protein
VAARRGLRTRIYEARPTAGGGLRSGELTEPGVTHDICSSVHPMGAASPFFRSLPLAQFGLEWITPRAAAAHPLDDGSAAMLWNDVDRTASELGTDARAYRQTIGRTSVDWPALVEDVLAPLGVPRHPLIYARFGLDALRSATGFARSVWKTDRARALFAGSAAHSVIPLTAPGSAAIGIVLAAVGHAHGWPVARGGSQRIADALVAYFTSLGGEVVVDSPVTAFGDLPEARHYFFDTSAPALADIMGDRFPQGFASQLRAFPAGPGVFKVDWLLREPIPWRAVACRESATVHVGGTMVEITAAESAPWNGECAERPFVLVTQPSICDPSRAGDGRHTAWGYCHVPSGSTQDMTARIEAQIERFAPGFRDVIVARVPHSPTDLQRDNANLVGGDIGGGSNRLLNLLARPTWRWYRTPLPNVHLCSASTPPGGGAHGMCGYHAATRVLGPEVHHE